VSSQLIPTRFMRGRVAVLSHPQEGYGIQASRAFRGRWRYVVRVEGSRQYRDSLAVESATPLRVFAVRLVSIRQQNNCILNALARR
jgi:hypothetical protein